MAEPESTSLGLIVQQGPPLLTRFGTEYVVCIVFRQLRSDLVALRKDDDLTILAPPLHRHQDHVDDARRVSESLRFTLQGRRGGALARQPCVYRRLC